VLSVLTVALAWVVYRPVLGVALMVVAVAAIAGAACSESGFAAHARR